MTQFKSIVMVQRGELADTINVTSICSEKGALRGGRPKKLKQKLVILLLTLSRN